MSGAPAEVTARGAAPPPDADARAVLARLIHDDVLQSLGVAVLSVDLCRRLHERFRYEQALDELRGLVDALATARLSTAQLLPELQRALPARAAPAARPSLVVLAGAGATASAGSATVDRPAPSAAEISETLAACETQAERCRHQYDAGLGEETMRDLELLLQRLDFVTGAFRAILGILREQPAQPAHPARPARPAAAHWARTA